MDSRPFWWYFGWFVVLIPEVLSAEGVVGTIGQPIPRIPAGTPVVGDSAPGWSHILLVSQSRVSQGDTEQVSQTVKSYASLFQFVMMANVEKIQNGSENRHQLTSVGVGLAATVDGRLVVATGPTPAGTISPKLSFLSTQVLRQMEQTFEETQIVARHPTLVIFDSPAILLDEHRRHTRRIMRNAIWTDPRKGGVGSSLWVIRERQGGGFEVDGNQGVFLPAGTREDRELHVDAGEFTLGIPGPSAFALVRLPPGRNFAIHPGFSQVCAFPRYDGEQLKQFGTELSTAMSNLAPQQK